MCGGSASSEGGSGGNSGGENYNNLSKSEKWDKLDKMEDNNSQKLNNLMRDIREGKEKAGSDKAKEIVDKINTRERKINIARDVASGYSKEALYSKYGSERKEGNKTSKTEIDKIYEKWK